MPDEEHWETECIFKKVNKQNLSAKCRRVQMKRDAAENDSVKTTSEANEKPASFSNIFPFAYI